jgi:transcriptional regulator with XRE-family HTH domain
MDRLKAARERAGKSPAELAAAMEISRPHYYDLESCNDELYMTVSLSELRRLCAELDISPRYLFSGEQTASETSTSFSSLAKIVATYLDDNHMSLASFEDMVGWTLDDFTTTPERAWDWNVDCLRDVCAALGVQWLDALP